MKWLRWLTKLGEIWAMNHKRKGFRMLIRLTIAALILAASGCQTWHANRETFERLSRHDAAVMEYSGVMD